MQVVRIVPFKVSSSYLNILLHLWENYTNEKHINIKWIKNMFFSSNEIADCNIFYIAS